MATRKGFPSGSVIKNLPVMQEMLVLSLGREDPVEEEMATHSSISAGIIPRTEEPGGLPSIRSQSRTRLERLSTRTQEETGESLRLSIA